MLGFLVFVSGVLLSSATLIDFVAEDSRQFYCSDSRHWVGDCADDVHRSVSGSYGYHLDEGRYVGRGYYRVGAGRDAQLVCDFRNDGGVRDDARDVAWVKVAEGRSRSRGGYRHGGDGGRLRSDPIRPGDVYSNRYRHSSVVISQRDRSTYFIRDFTAEEFGTYRCYGTTRTGNDVIYMEVDFEPRLSSGRKVTDIVFTTENAF